MADRLSEFEIIERYFAPLAGQGSFGFQDDAACLALPQGQSLVVTQDAVAEGIHFFADDPPDLIARKALRVNLSDLTAKGAEPFAYSLSLGLANKWDESWIAEFANGLTHDSNAFGIELIGGDTFRTGGGFVISITALGTVRQQEYVTRLGAHAEDAVFVTGTIGDSALGLWQRRNSLAIDGEEKAFLDRRYLVPEPRTSATQLIRRFATASMDVSDGLVADAGKLALASQCGIDIECSKIPLSAAARSAIKVRPELLETALTGGDDYEILFTANPSDSEAIVEAAMDLDVPITPIGRMTAGKAVTVFNEVGEPMSFASTGYDHSGPHS